jgi:hypothetical protein
MHITLVLYFTGSELRRHQKYTLGYELDCSTWLEDAQNCDKYYFEDDMEALVIVLFSLIDIFYLESFHLKLPCNLYRIVAIFKVEMDIIANISASPIGRAGIFVIMSVEAFRTDIIVFIRPSLRRGVFWYTTVRPSVSHVTL